VYSKGPDRKLEKWPASTKGAVIFFAVLFTTGDFWRAIVHVFPNLASLGW
jgi:hypothetical protein